MFLQWVKGNSVIEKEENEDEEQGENNKVEIRGCHGYKVVKTPGYGNLTVDELIHKFYAADKSFFWYLEEFLLAHSLPILPSHNVLFGVFKHMSVTLPQIPQVSNLTSLMSNPNAQFRGKPQKMTTATGEAKGLQQTLEERGFDISRMHVKCLLPSLPIQK
jgi:hypothetical protein